MKFVVLALVALYAAYFSFYTCIAHGQFRTYAYDLGTFDQGIWLAGHGTNYFVTVRGLHLLGDHVRFFSFVLAPLYWIWDDVRALLVMQSVAIGFGGWFVWRIAERELPGRPWLALSLAAGYLLNPAVQNLNLDHAHPDAFASTFLLASINFLRAGRLVPFSIAAALAMSCKEDIPLVFVAMGIALMLDRRQRRFGLVLASVAGVYFVLCMKVILPHFNGVGFFRVADGGFLGGVAAHSTDPWWILARVLRWESAVYLFKVGLPNLFLFLLAPVSIVPALPAVMANLLSDAQYMRSLDFHYQTSILPFLYLATMQALARIDALRGRGPSAPRSSALARIRRAVASRGAAFVGAVAPAALLAAALGTNAAWSRAPLHRAGSITEMWGALKTYPRIAKMEEVLATIPKDAVVSADYTLVPHLSHRRQIYMFPNPFRASYWGLRNEHLPDPETVEYVAVRNVPGREPVTQLAEELVAANSFERIAGDGDFGLYRRKDRVFLSDHASCGDWTGDGKVAADDFHWISDAIMKERDCPPRVCDVDHDGQVRYADVLRLGKHIRDPTIPLSCPP